MRRLFSALLLLAFSLAAQYTVKPESEMPAGVPDAVKAMLKPEGQSIFEGDTKLLTLFYVATVPAGSNAENAVTNKDIAHGTILGIANFPAESKDRRGNVVKAGTYLMRFSFFPVNGAHQGIEPQRDFLILTDPSIDSDFAAQPNFNDLMPVAIKSASSQHPMALSCWKNDYDQAPGLVKEGEDSHPEWVLYTTIGDKKIAIIVVGQHTEG
jgi:hypothetical protein